MPNPDADRIIELYQSRQPANLELGLQLEKTLQIDLSGFWAGCTALYQRVFEKPFSNPRKKTILEKLAQVQTLELSHTDFPALFDWMAWVSSVRLERVRLDGADFPYMPAVNNLEINGFEGDRLPDCLAQKMPNLRTVSIQNAPALRALPDTFCQLSALTTLRVNAALQTLPSRIGNCTALEILHVAENKLIELPADLLRCQNLRELHLAKNPLNYLPSDLALLPKLKHVDWSYTQLDKEYRRAFVQTALRDKLVIFFANGIN